MPPERVRVLIWGKTYPELSSTYTETVCTGGCREDGAPIRLYPVPLRYLEPDQQYSLYHWIDVPVAKSSKDPRPESHRIESGEIRVGDRVPSDQSAWAGRRDIIFRDKSWHYNSVGDLKADQQRSNKSLGLVTPGEICDVRKVKRGDRERAEYDDMKVLDWGLLELGRRTNWDAACQKLQEISDLQRYEFRLYMGNFRLHPQVFGILGFWYPKIPEQQQLI